MEQNLKDESQVFPWLLDRSEYRNRIGKNVECKHCGKSRRQVTVGLAGKEQRQILDAVTFAGPLSTSSGLSF